MYRLAPPPFLWKKIGIFNFIFFIGFAFLFIIFLIYLTKKLFLFWSGIKRPLSLFCRSVGTWFWFGCSVTFDCVFSIEYRVFPSSFTLLSILLFLLHFPFYKSHILITSLTQNLVFATWDAAQPFLVFLSYQFCVGSFQIFNFPDFQIQNFN